MMIQAGTLSECRRQLQIQGAKLLAEVAGIEATKDYSIEEYEIWQIRAEHLILKFELLNHLERYGQKSEQGDSE